MAPASSVGTGRAENPEAASEELFGGLNKKQRRHLRQLQRDGHQTLASAQ
jgi:hypothetical protein